MQVSFLVRLGLGLSALVASTSILGSTLISTGWATTPPKATTFPNPRLDAPTPPGVGRQTAVLAGGCFWGVEAVFEHVRGVTHVVSGFAGGPAATANYKAVSNGQTGHAEAVQITYDPQQVSYGQLLKVYFSIAHDPTQLNRQGPDQGSQYRSAIFFSSAQQQQIAQAYIQQLRQVRVFPQPIVTQVEPLRGFYAAEAYHQNFVSRNPTHPYVVFHDLPKLAQFKAQLPGLYRP